MRFKQKAACMAAVIAIAVTVVPGISLDFDNVAEAAGGPVKSPTGVATDR